MGVEVSVGRNRRTQVRKGKEGGRRLPQLSVFADDENGVLGPGSWARWGASRSKERKTGGERKSKEKSVHRRGSEGETAGWSARKPSIQDHRIERGPGRSESQQ